jgi:outer membrane protein OmpA-like peptidoglycan-associated protein
MAQDWLADVRKYVSDADEGIVKGIVRYCGIALTKVDSSLVSFSDSKETDRVRNNFLKKKLALTDPDSVLDEAIAAVGQRMKADRRKNRVTVYYLLAENFGKLDLFAGKAKAAAGGAAAAGAAAAGVAALSSAGDAKAAPAKQKAAAPKAAPAPAPAPEVKAAPVAAAAVAAVAATAIPVAAATSSDDNAKPAYAAASAARYDPGTNWALWGALFIGGIILAGVLAMMISATRNTVVPMPATATAPAPTAPAPAPAAPVAEPAPVAAPQGSGVLASERNGKPMLTVYFDTGKSAVAPDFPAVSAEVKAYLDANPAAKLAVSGFNDPTGNAAANARLSKNRAQSVKAAIEKLGIAPDRVLLEKPPEASGTGADNAASRRVEAVIKE